MGSPETTAMLERARAEEAVVFDGPDGPLAGIFTPPAHAVGLPPRCVVFPGRPRFASQRLAVIGARTLAAEGFAALRFDLHGHGESGGVTEPIDRKHPCGGDVEAALRYLREARGYRRFLLVGYCFDALSALAAFRNEAAAIDGLFFAAGPVAESSNVAVAPARASREMRDSARSLLARLASRWRKVNSFDQSRSPDPAHGTPSRSGDERPSVGPASDRPREPAKIMEIFETAFTALMRSQASALFLYGDRDESYDEFREVERRWFTSFDNETRRRIQLELWSGQVHVPESETATLQRAITWVRTFEPADEIIQPRMEVSEPSDPA